MITSEQLKEIQNRAAELGRYLDIDKKKIELEEAQLHTQAPDFWEDPKKAEKQMKTVKELERWVNGYKEVCTDVDELSLAVDFHKEGMVEEEEVDDAYAKAVEKIEALEMKNMLRREEDQMSCVLKINSGAGGTESQDWASMLMRMYMPKLMAIKLRSATCKTAKKPALKPLQWRLKAITHTVISRAKTVCIVL